MSIPVQDLPTAGSIESSLRQAATSGMVADADFATNEATTLANVATRNAILRPEQIPLYYSTRAAISLGFKLLGATLMTGGSLAAIYAAVDGNWQPGFAVTL